MLQLCPPHRIGDEHACIFEMDFADDGMADAVFDLPYSAGDIGNGSRRHWRSLLSPENA